MTVEELIKKEIFQVIEEGEDLSRKVTKVFCCDCYGKSAVGQRMGDGHGQCKYHCSGNIGGCLLCDFGRRYTAG